jgi:hypothetical protein
VRARTHTTYVTMVLNISLSTFLFLLGIASFFRLLTNGGWFFTKKPYSKQFLLPQFTPFTKNVMISTINLDSYDTALLSIISSKTLTMSLSLFSNFNKHQDFSIRTDFEIIKERSVYRRCISGSISTLSKISCKFSALDHSNINSIKSLKVNVILTPFDSTSTRLSILESMSAQLVLFREQTRLSLFLNYLNIPMCASFVFTLFLFVLFTSASVRSLSTNKTNEQVLSSGYFRIICYRSSMRDLMERSSANVQCAYTIH